MNTKAGGAVLLDALRPESFGLSAQYWNKLSERDRGLYALVRPTVQATYTVDVELGYIERHLEDLREDCIRQGGSFNLEPEFQRDHVWTDEQRSRYIEALMRGLAPILIRFNCPGWREDPAPGGNIPLQTFECIDGLQRLTAVRKFLAGEVTVFGGMKVSDFDATCFSLRRARYRLQFAVHEFSRRTDLYQFYLDLNAGGTPHSPKDLEKVRRLWEQAAIEEGLVESPAQGAPDRIRER